MIGCSGVYAQFLRLGPFDFDAKTRLEAIYTTNVEQERPSEATAERRDYYLVLGLDLTSASEFMPVSRLTLDAGIAFEKHFIRDDLDNSEAPFGYFGARWETTRDPIRINAESRFERTSESLDETYIPVGKGVSRKKRQVGSEWSNIVGFDWEQRFLAFGVSYEYTEERFDSDDFLEEESDEQIYNYYLELRPHEYVLVRYEMDRTKTDFINQLDGEGEWEGEKEITLEINVNELFGLFDRPEITYGIGIENEYDENGESEGWELIHTLTIRDIYEMSEKFRWGYFVTYEYTQDMEEDDEVTLEFALNVDHQLSETISHSFTARRTPVDTLGSTDDTAETEYMYSIALEDFPILNVVSRFSSTYTISDPIDGPTEKTWDYTLDVTHSVELNPRLRRNISYMYTRENSNLEDELLVEHRVELSFVYDL